MKKTKVAALVLSLAMIAGCTSTASSAAPSATGTYTPGTYEATAVGFGGEVKVTMTFDAENVTDVKIEAGSETPSVGGAAAETLAAAVMEKQSAEIDTVSGASITSGAVKTAVENCFAQAKGESTEVAVKMAPGTYTALGTGFRYSERIKVDVTVNETEIEKIVVDKENSEKPAILETVIDLMVPRMIENQSVAVDAICGATASSNGVRMAVTDCLKQALVAGGSEESAISAFQVVPAPTGVTETLDTDVLVVGLGGAGLTAAISAAENGAKVLVIEKTARIGGNGPLTSGPTAINIPSQVATEYPEWTDPLTKEVRVKAAGEKFVDEEAFLNTWLEYTTCNGVQQAKPEMVKMLIEQSGETADWLMDSYGFQFDVAAGFAGNVWAVCVNHSGAKALTQGFYDGAVEKLVEMGGEYMLETEGTELIMDGDAVVGAKAVSKADGTEYIINAKEVILATGGFAANAEMTTKYLSDEYYPLSGEWKLFGQHQNDGKMIESAIQNGAGTFNIGVTPCVHNAGSVSYLSGYEPIAIEGAIGWQTQRQAYYSVADIPASLGNDNAAFNVNKKGVRFANEEKTSMFDPWKAGNIYYSIYSEERLKEIAENGFTEPYTGPSGSYLGYYGTAIPTGVALPEMFDVLADAENSGIVVKADTMEELAGKLGIDAAVLTDTVAKYNSACEAGVDEEFGKAANHLVAVGDGPYYAVKMAPYCYATCGGLDVNESLQVLGTDGTTPIKGLYAVGTDSSGVLYTEHDAYVDYGGAAMGWSYTSGRVAGAHAAAEAAK